jgi:hypothetical protein
MEARDEADVVLYLVNATEDPETAGYMKHELELLSWMGRPVLVLLNQKATTKLREGGYNVGFFGERS